MNHNPIDLQNPNVVQQLRPRNPQGVSTATYELTKATAHPTRIVGRDARGMPVEDTIPTVFWRPFLMADGCINKVPLRTASVPSMHADAVSYENETMYDLITSGCIPAWLCPYSTQYASWTHGPFATPPNGETDCGGSNGPNGCVHLQAIAKSRKEHVLECYRRDQDSFTKEYAHQRSQELAQMRDGIVEGVSEAMARHLTPQAKAEAARQKLRDGG